MKPRNLQELKAAIERNEVLYLRADDFTVKRQIWQTLMYLREMLRNTRQRNGRKAA